MGWAEDTFNESAEQPVSRGAAEVDRPAVETQKIRSVLQGATLGFADEIEAMARSAILGEGDYDQIRNDIRQKIKDYQEAYPGESISMEVLGAAAPTALALLIPGAQAAGAANIARLGGMAGVRQVAKVGAAEGAVTSYGTGEEGLLEDLLRVPTGAALGATTGAVTKPLFDIAGGLATGLTNQARTMFGNRAGSAVQAEVNRLADELYPKTPDEIVADLMAGRLMTENETLIKSLRAYMAKGGQAGAKITETIPRRAAETRQEAMGMLQEGLTPGITDNVFAAAKQSEKAFKEAQSADYNRIFRSGQKVDLEMTDTISEALVRLPNAQSALDKVYKARGNLVPFYKFDDAGRLQIVRQPTVEDAELVRRAIDEATTKAFKEGEGAVGEALSPLESQLRKQLDEAFPELRDVRSNWRKLNTARDAFKLGRQSIGKPADEIEFEFQKLIDANDVGAIRTFRAGFMDALRNKARRSPGVFAKLGDEDTSEGALLRIVFPEDQVDDVIRAVQTAGQAQRVKQKTMDASPTSIDLGAQQRIGDYVSAGDMQGALSGNPRDIMRVGSGIVRSMAPELSDKERKQVIDIVMTDDPDILRRALLDDTAFGNLQKKITSVVSAISQGAQRGVRVQAGEKGGGFSESTKMILEGLAP